MDGEPETDGLTAPVASGVALADAAPTAGIAVAGDASSGVLTSWNDEGAVDALGVVDDVVATGTSISSAGAPGVGATGVFDVCR